MCVSRFWLTFFIFVLLLVWRIIRPLLDERTANRVVWLSDGGELRKEIEESFSKGDVPQWLGGGANDMELELLNGAIVNAESLTGRFS